MARAASSLGREEPALEKPAGAERTGGVYEAWTGPGLGHQTEFPAVS